MSFLNESIWSVFPTMHSLNWLFSCLGQFNFGRYINMLMIYVQLVQTQLFCLVVHLVVIERPFERYVTERKALDVVFLFLSTILPRRWGRTYSVASLCWACYTRGLSKCRNRTLQRIQEAVVIFVVYSISTRAFWLFGNIPIYIYTLTYSGTLLLCAWITNWQTDSYLSYWMHQCISELIGRTSMTNKRINWDE